MNEPRTTLSHHVKLLSLVQILCETVEVAYITATLRDIAKCRHCLAFKHLPAALRFAASCFDRHWNSTRHFALFPRKSWQKTSYRMSTSQRFISPRLTLYCTILHVKQVMKTLINQLTIHSVSRFSLSERTQLSDLRNQFLSTHVNRIIIHYTRKRRMTHLDVITESAQFELYSWHYKVETARVM